MDKGLLIVVSAPSGGGKGTVLKKVLSKNQNLRYSVSATTRLPREGEQDGVHYNFVSKPEFEEMLKENKLLEYTTYCENYYGTIKEQVEKAREQGFDIVLEIEVEGFAQVKKMIPDAVCIFLSPPSIEELETRLRNRGTENEETIQKRLSKARVEMPCALRYDYFVINDIVDNAADKIQNIITAEKCTSQRNSALIERIINLC